MPLSELESTIMQRLASGDLSGAADGIVAAYASEVLGRCVNLVGDPAAGEDLAQEAFVRALAALPGFRGEAAIRTWLFAIVRNVCIDHLRRRQRLATWTDDEAAVEEQADETLMVLLAAERGPLMAAFARLSDADRALVSMRYVDGLDHAELAELFGIREGAARMRLARALDQMRERLVRQPIVRSAPGRRGWLRRASPSEPAAPVSAASADEEVVDSNFVDLDGRFRELLESVRAGARRAPERSRESDRSLRFSFPVVADADERTTLQELEPIRAWFGRRLADCVEPVDARPLLERLRSAILRLADAPTSCPTPSPRRAPAS